jgi:hypothetical protein
MVIRKVPVVSRESYVDGELVGSICCVEVNVLSWFPICEWIIQPPRTYVVEDASIDNRLFYDGAEWHRSIRYLYIVIVAAKFLQVDACFNFQRHMSVPISTRSYLTSRDGVVERLPELLAIHIPDNGKPRFHINLLLAWKMTLSTSEHCR